jgi:hypothetical protein
LDVQKLARELATKDTYSALLGPEEEWLPALHTLSSTTVPTMQNLL